MTYLEQLLAVSENFSYSCAEKEILKFSHTWDLSENQSFYILSVVPKMANLRNHQGAITDASTREFISKLELESKCTRHSGTGT
ncbi:retroelement silencing factor 1 isoform X4 [Vulpes vulpes]|uniref:Retroelement silencing factor 1 isoform X4 n=1 Tax=Vulpes vulpes TaxID=9627 RepID=A0ABM5B3V0_VULVU